MVEELVEKGAARPSTRRSDGGTIIRRATDINAATWPSKCGHRASFCALLFLANRAS
jgi:hypothetical protein